MPGWRARSQWLEILIGRCYGPAGVEPGGSLRRSQSAIVHPGRVTLSAAVPVTLLGVASKIDPEDLIDTAGVAAILTLASRSSVGAYQRRYPDMPRPVVNLNGGRIRLWSRRSMLQWASSTGRMRTK